MKKITLILTAALAAIAITACGGNKTENVETESAAQETSAQSGETASGSGDYTAVSLPEDYEQSFYEGDVSDYTGSFITVEGEDGPKKFDLEGADMSDQDITIVRGCYVEVSYADNAENGTYPADGISLLNDNEQLAQELDKDPVIYGKLQYMDVNELEIVDDAGRTVDFDNTISRTVSFSELKQGDDVVVTYAGTVFKDDTDDEESTGIFDGVPVAIKVVAADAVKTEDAEANYMEGMVSGIEGGNFILSTELADFNCTADEAIVSSLSEEEKVRAYYTGAMSDIVISVDKVEAVG